LLSTELKDNLSSISITYGGRHYGLTYPMTSVGWPERGFGVAGKIEKQHLSMVLNPMNRASSTKSIINRDFESALAALQAGKLGDAVQLFHAVLRVEPKHVGTLNLMGVVLTQLGRFTEAETYLRRALQHHPLSDATLYNYGIVLKLLNRPVEALQRFSEAVKLNPSVAESWNNRGTIFNDLKRYEEAIADFDKAIALNPRYAEAFNNKGKSLLALKRGDEALAAFGRALAINSGLAEAWLGRGLVLGVVGNHQGALSAFDRALALNPNLAEAWIGRGKIFLQLQQCDYALAAYDRALALNANFAEAWFGRADVFVHLNEPDKALATFDRALALKRDMGFAQGGRLHLKLSLSDWTNLDAELAELVSTIRAEKHAIAPFNFLAMAPTTAADQLQCAKTFMAEQASFSPLWRGEIYSHDRIRTGYLSADFRTHAIAELAVGVFEHHDKSRFEITALSCGPDDGSDLRNRIKSAAENFIDVRTMTDDEIAELIRRREIAVIVDLTGLTLYNRFSVLSRRVAPIQVNFLGYPCTTGDDCMDYIIADSTIIPADHFRFYSEQVVWLPDTYQPNDDKRLISERLPTRAECNLPEVAFVFCCFNSTYKITPQVFAVWMRLLSAIEGSVLWLIETNPIARQNLRKEAKARGISPERLIFAPKMPLADHLSRHRHADLFLDTLPYNAHTTASDALWTGVPVLACLGETFAGRVAASLLKAVGVPELITTSLADYEALALKLAREPSFLASIKAKLARNRDAYPLFDTARFTRHIEAAYETMWQRHQSGAAPQAFAVERID
jgi:protein O-GlcNAc transferase